MKKILAIFSALLFCAAAGSANAVAVGSGGGSGDFTWGDGLGDTVDFPAFGTDDNLELTSLGSFFDIFVDDCCVIGDAFGLLIDDVLTAWTTDGFTGPGGLYHAEKIGLFLAAGVHTIDFLVTADCCGSGFGSWSIAPGVGVPEPTTVALLGLGLLGAGLRRRATA